MGCLSSTLNPSQPPHSNRQKRKETLYEETKNPELLRRSSSSEIRPQSIMTFPKKIVKPVEPLAESKPIQEPSRKNTPFNLDKDIIGILQNELESRDALLSQKKSVSREQEDNNYKLSKQQHSQIFEFVRDKNCIFQSNINKLYDNLANNKEETQGLYEIVENLKSYNRDIENCLDDLRTFPIPNEKKAYKQFEKNNQFIQNLVIEYELFTKQECSYEKLKDATLDLIIRYNTNVLENSVSEKLVEGKGDEKILQDKGTLASIPGDETQADTMGHIASEEFPEAQSKGNEYISLDSEREDQKIVCAQSGANEIENCSMVENKKVNGKPGSREQITSLKEDCYK